MLHALFSLEAQCQVRRFVALANDHAAGRRENMLLQKCHVRYRESCGLDLNVVVHSHESILNLDDADAEAHWGGVLSRYGIEYVEDPASGERVPTCHRVQLEGILNDPDCLAAFS